MFTIVYFTMICKASSTLSERKLHRRRDKRDNDIDIKHAYYISDFSTYITLHSK